MIGAALKSSIVYYNYGCYFCVCVYMYAIYEVFDTSQGGRRRGGRSQGGEGIWNKPGKGRQVCIEKKRERKKEWFGFLQAKDAKSDETLVKWGKREKRVSKCQLKTLLKGSVLQETCCEY